MRNDDVRLAVVEVGDPGAPAVVMAHGVGSSARFVIAAFAASVQAGGRRLVAYDLRGHGDSTAIVDPGGHDLDRHVADLAAVMASIRGTIDVVGGVSLGGHAAVRWAAAQGWAGPLVTCLPSWTGVQAHGSGPHAAVAAAVASVGVSGLLGRLRTDQEMPRWLRATVVADFARHDPASLATALGRLDGAVGPHEWELEALTGELTVVGWPDDPWHPLAVAHEWAALAPRPRLRLLALDDLDAGLHVLGDAALSGLGVSGPRPARP